MPQLITFFVQNGIPEYAIIWILMIPVAMTVVIMGRQIIGIKGFGITTPLLIAFSFAATGIQAGVIIFLSALGVGLLTLILLRKIRLLYLPKMALLLSAVTLAVLLIVALLPFHKEMQFPQAIFSFIILILLVEQFASYLMERGLRKTFNIALETFALSVAAFFVITWGWLQGVLISYPLFAIIAVLSINLFLGKWTGLRISEYIRFKDLIFRK